MRGGAIPLGEKKRLAESALAKLRDYRLGPYTDEELQALEETIRLMRPSAYVRDGLIESLPPDVTGIFAGWPRFCELFRPFTWSIGRIDARPPTKPGAAYISPMEPVGSGFLVGERMLVTNTHVLDAATRKTRAIARSSVYVWFKMERDSPQENAVEIVGVEDVHATLDLALLRLGDAPELSGRPPLPIATSALTEGDEVVAVGYPMEDPATRRMNPEFLGVIFGDGYGQKRAAPGEVMQVPSLTHFYHDCSTLSGNSGSPVLSLANAQVVGIHRYGRFMTNNEAIAVAELVAFLT
jgi:S1-C subfamily serine protease